ncbi:hypothetical protein LHYA1_G001928 [Lachnellula hyalina]|uniref:Mid2 domain-containing protein n=1 Tax=Lachnellula hyalina TaxID=1316788 RepID=A0A8H8R5W0_9HELO|nr:uncharacterized protein LHYA1_G001928 [Lachnellula hyalina]TVY28576.1 hypothetical protein LHYA1_G001928 [Lachnellula hyalina]
MGRLLLLAPLFFAAVNATATCWYPDNKTSEPTHVPCNQTTSTASACCDPNDSCSVSGFCLDPETQKAEPFWAAVWSCTPAGTPPTKFCCGFGPESCCNSSFTLGTTGVAFKPGLDAYVQSISAAAVSSAMATVIASTVTSTTPSPAQATTSQTSQSVEANCSSSGDDLGTKIGVGIGVPLGVMAVGILSFLFWRESRRRDGGGGIGLVDLKGAGNGEVYRPPQPWKGPMSPVQMRSYSPDQQKVYPWSPVAPPHEIDTSPRVQELPNPGLGKQ